MKFLFIVKQKKNVDTFEQAIARLLEAGHVVKLAIQQRDETRDGRLAEQFGRAGFELVTCPEGRGDAWRASAPLLRSARDWAQYFRAPYVHASKLRKRVTERLVKELGAQATVNSEAITLGAAPTRRLLATLEQVEAAIPSDPLHEEFIQRHAPDVVLVTPGLHFGSAQADFIKSARALGIPAWMLLYSWDNLSTKGALHVAPDLMFVWNERQRREAVELHGYPPDRVIPVGAPRFDEFFALSPAMPREAFFKPLALDPARPTLLYVCSSRFIAERELRFIEEWLAALRASEHPALRECNVIVRPHPDVTLVDHGDPPETVTWPAMRQATGWVQRPFADRAAIVLRTTYSTPQAFYECLAHSAAVVGLNTSAELEAGIVGRPVFTVLSDREFANGQSNTLHFDYLLKEQGGFVVCAPDLATHLSQLAEALAAPPAAAPVRAFIEEFLRPRGEGSVSALLAETLVSSFHARIPEVGSVRATAPPESPAAAGDAVEPQDEAAKSLVLGYPGSTARILATPETRRSRRRGVLVLDPATTAWLEQVDPGGVFYDIGAGVGAYSIAAATHRGALAVAFEPGFATFKRLCDNLLLNTCTRSVIPLPIALGERTGLLELEYPHEPGNDHHSLRPRTWRPGRDAIASLYTQPVCAERLDELVRRHHLPKPHAIRIAGRRGAGAIVRGAGALWRGPQLRSVLVSVRDDEEAAAVAQALERYGFSAAAGRGRDGGRTLAFDRTSPAGTMSRAWSRLVQTLR